MTAPRLAIAWSALVAAHLALAIVFAERALGFATVYLPIGLAQRLGVPLRWLAHQPGWFIGWPKPLGWIVAVAFWLAVHAALAALLLRAATATRWRRRPRLPARRDR